MSNVATRLFSLILLLQRRPIWKSAELAAELGVSERTIHRYMGMLDEMGIPIYSERGPYGGFALMRGYKLPPLLFTAEEATVLYMGANLVKEIWGQTYGDAVTSVMAKLDNVLSDDLRQEVARMRQSLVIGDLTRMNYHPWEPVIHKLRQCIRDRRSVSLTYQGFVDQEPLERVVRPYALTLQWGLWYLIGFCELRQGMRTFRVDRIQRVVPLDQYFDLPADFSVKEYLAQAIDFQPVYRVVVHVQATIAHEVRERHGHWMGIEDRADGSILVRFPASTLDWAASWALSCGPEVKVLEPPELVVRVRKAAQDIVQQYASEAF